MPRGFYCTSLARSRTAGRHALRDLLDDVRRIQTNIGASKSGQERAPRGWPAGMAL